MQCNENDLCCVASLLVKLCSDHISVDSDREIYTYIIIKVLFFFSFCHHSVSPLYFSVFYFQCFFVSSSSHLYLAAVFCKIASILRILFSFQCGRTNIRKICVDVFFFVFLFFSSSSFFFHMFGASLLVLCVMYRIVQNLKNEISLARCQRKVFSSAFQ